MDGQVQGLDIGAAVVEILEGYVEEVLDAVDIDGSVRSPVFPRVICIRYGRVVAERQDCKRCTLILAVRIV